MMLGAVSRLWSMSLQAGILILVILTIRFFLKKYPKIYAYCLWILAGIRLLCPVFVETPYSLQPETLRPEEITQSRELFSEQESYFQGQLPENQGIQTNISEKENAFFDGSDRRTDSGTEVRENNNLPDNNQGMPDHENRSTRLYLKMFGFDLTGVFDILAVIYLAGTGVFFIFYVTQYLVMKRRISTAVNGEENVWFSEKIDSPFVLGIIRPRIIMPYGLKKQESCQILKHEQMHIKHHDPLIRLAGILCICLHWWNPLVWLAVSKMNQDMEMFCDEAVLRDASPEERKSYAKILLSFAEKRSGSSMGLAFGESHTERRVRNLAWKRKGGILITGLVAILAIFCIVAFMTTPRMEDEGTGKIIELPEIREIQTVQYNSIKIPVDRLETETLMALVQDLESLCPVKDDHIEMNGIYDTISLIYENGSKDVFLFWKENDSWYAETLDGDIYENADFVQNYIDRTEIDFRPSVSVPDLFWIKFLNTYDYNDDYDILSELVNCLAQGYSLKQAAGITEAKVRCDEMLYQYAVSQNFEPTDEELQNYMSEILGQLKTMPNYTDLETAFTESGTTIEKEIDKRDQNIRKDLSIQMLYNDRYDAFRCGEDMIGETVYWDFEAYWNAFLEKTVLTQQLSDEADIESQMTKALDYVISNKETLEKELEIVITLENVNLFQYALEIKDGVFSPREVDFFMSTEEVLQATGLNEYTVFEKDGGNLIRTNINISGFSDNIMVDYVFDDAIGNLLVTIRYVFEVDEAEAADIYNLIYEQAVSVMPEASGNTIEGIKDGIDVSWEDKEQNYVRLWFSNGGNSHPGTGTIMLQIQATRNSPFLPEELKNLYENSLLRQ